MTDYFTKFPVPSKSVNQPWLSDLYCNIKPSKCKRTTPKVVDVPLQVLGKYLTDGNGNRIMLKGTSVGTYGLLDSFDREVSDFDTNTVKRIASTIRTNATKCNTVRLLWFSERAGGATYSMANLDFLLKTYIDNGFIPVLGLWDASIEVEPNIFNNVATFDELIAPFWNDVNVQSIIKKYDNKIILNLANEWGHTNWGKDNDDIDETIYKTKYNALVLQLRNAGIKSPIMIDAPNYGRSSDLLISYGNDIINNDPLKNILLSVHPYWSRAYNAITQAGCETEYINRIDAMSKSNLPFVLGEVSNWADPSNQTEALVPIDFTCATIDKDLNPNLIPNNANQLDKLPGIGNENTNILFAINYDLILTTAVADEIGYYTWVWYKDNTATRCLFDHDTGGKLNTDPRAGNWPKDIMSSSKVYGLNK